MQNDAQQSIESMQIKREVPMRCLNCHQHSAAACCSASGHTCVERAIRYEGLRRHAGVVVQNAQKEVNIRARLVGTMHPGRQGQGRGQRGSGGTMQEMSSRTTSAWPPASRTRSPSAAAADSAAKRSPSGAPAGAAITVVWPMAPPCRSVLIAASVSGVLHMSMS